MKGYGHPANRRPRRMAHAGGESRLMEEAEGVGVEWLSVVGLEPGADLSPLLQSRECYRVVEDT